MIGNTYCFWRKNLNTINFPLNTALAVCHTFWYVSTFFFFYAVIQSKIFPNFTCVWSFDQWDGKKCGLFNFQVLGDFTCIILQLIPNLIPLWSKLLWFQVFSAFWDLPYHLGHSLKFHSWLSRLCFLLLCWNILSFL